MIRILTAMHFMARWIGRFFRSCKLNPRLRVIAGQWLTLWGNLKICGYMQLSYDWTSLSKYTERMFWITKSQFIFWHVHVYFAPYICTSSFCPIFFTHSFVLLFWMCMVRCVHCVCLFIGPFFCSTIFWISLAQNWEKGFFVSPSSKINLTSSAPLTFIAFLRDVFQHIVYHTA